MYEDGVLLVVDKPANILVHSDGTASRTLTDAVVVHLAAEGARRRPQAVQRLDVGTSGLVLFSLTAEFQPALDAQVAGHGMHKRYLAVVGGSFPAGERVIDRPLGRDRHDARRMRVSPTGKAATTRVRRLAHAGGRSLLEVELLTGRRHQIRVHLASMGFPIVGDELYGGAPCTDGLLLHALSEDVQHPLTGEVLHLQTDWPARLGAWPRSF